MRPKRVLPVILSLMLFIGSFGIAVPAAEAEEITVVTAAMSPEPGDLAVVGSMIA